MKRYLWSNRDEYGIFFPYAILECSDETAKILENLKKKKLWRFIADRLHEKYPNQFPTWLDNSGKRRPFWHNNMLEDYDTSYKRLVKEGMNIIRDIVDFIFEYNFYYAIANGLVCYGDERNIREKVEWEISEDLKSLPVYVI
jgi:hypothetical protein